MHRPRAGAFPFLSYLRGTTIARHACAGAPSAMALQDDAIAPAQADQLQSADPADWPVAPDWQPLVEDFFAGATRSEEHTSELQSQSNLVCRLLLEKKNKDTRLTI